MIGQSARRRLSEAFYSSQLTAEDFGKADLTSVGLNTLRFERCIFAGADLRQSTILRCWFRFCDLRGVNLRGASVRYTSFAGCDLRDADLRDCDLTGTSFRRVNTGTERGRTSLRGAIFDGANLTDVQ